MNTSFKVLSLTDRAADRIKAIMAQADRPVAGLLRVQQPEPDLGLRLRRVGGDHARVAGTGAGLRLRPGPPSGGLGRRGDRGVVHHAVATAALGGEHAQVGPLQQRGRRVPGAVLRDADGHRYLAQRFPRGTLDEFPADHAGADRFRDSHRIEPVGAGQDDTEFLTAEPGEAGIRLHALTHHHGHKAQDLITGQMAELVVEALEVIDIDDDHAEITAGSHGSDRRVHHLLEMLAVGEAAQGIGQALRARGFELLPQALDLAPALADAGLEDAVIGHHLPRRCRQGGDHLREARPAELRLGQVMSQRREGFAVLLRRAKGEVQHLAHRGQFRQYRLADMAGIGGAALAVEIAVVQVIDIALGEMPLLGRDAFDGIVEERHLAGDVGVPNGIGPRRGRGTVIAHELVRPFRQGERPGRACPEGHSRMTRVVAKLCTRAVKGGALRQALIQTQHFSALNCSGRSKVKIHQGSKQSRRKPPRI
ncbi:hypothetical protein Lal_00046439 [Lupinus albus]|nr:hypothetical protein Lal_00046439 [Lupinus albus]